MGRAVFPPCCLACGQTVVEIMVTATSFKRTCSCPVVFSAPDPTAGHCRATPLPEAPGHSQASLAQSLVGTLLLSPGSWCTQSFVCAFQESVSPVLCKFWWLYGGVNGSTFKRAYATPRSAAPRASTTVAGHCWSVIHRRHSNTQRQLWLSLCGVSWYAQGFA